MDAQDLLIQRFLDQDLTPEERVQFLQQVDADPGLRREWLNLEVVVAEAGRLPRIAPSPHFRARVLAALEPDSKSILDLLSGVARRDDLRARLGLRSDGGLGRLVPGATQVVGEREAQQGLVDQGIGRRRADHAIAVARRSASSEGASGTSAKRAATACPSISTSRN